MTSKDDDLVWTRVLAKDELPAHSDTSLGAFVAGMGGYAALLVVVAH